MSRSKYILFAILFASVLAGAGTEWSSLLIKGDVSLDPSGTIGYVTTPAKATAVVKDIAVKPGTRTTGFGGQSYIFGGTGSTGGGDVTVQGGTATGAGMDGGTAWVIGGTPGAGGDQGIVYISSSTGITFNEGILYDVGMPWVATTTQGKGTYQLLGIAGGGTGQVTAGAAFNALSPLTSSGDLLTYGAGTNARLGTAPGDAGKPLVSLGGAAPNAWSTLGIVGGGTGAVTLTNHGVLLGQTTSAIVATAAGTAGQLLKSGGAAADPSWTTATFPNTATTGDIISATGTNVFGVIAASTTGYVLTSNGAGVAPTWQAATGGGLGVNYITNYSGDVDTTGWSTYADAAGVTPVDGTGGSPTVTWTRSNSAPLTGAGNFIFTTDAANRQGEGAFYAFTLATADKAKVMQIEFDYMLESGVLAAGSSSTDGDITVWIYDVSSSTLIQPSTYKLYSNSSTIPTHFVANFQTSATSTSYRLIFHKTSTTATAFVEKFDNIQVSPSRYTYGTPVTDSKAWTPTGSWVSNTTYSGFYRRVGDFAEYDVLLALTGAPTTATLTVNLPSGHTIDTAKLTKTTGSLVDNSDVIVVSAGVASAGHVAYSSTTAVQIYVDAIGTHTGTVPVNYHGPVTQALPRTFANADYIRMSFRVPIVGWSSNIQMSDSAPQSVVALVLEQTGDQTITTTTQTKITAAQTVKLDTIGSWDAANSQYTVRVPGNYLATSESFYAASTTVAEVWAAVAVNGTIRIMNTNKRSGASSNSSAAQVVGILENLKSGDLVTFYTYQSLAATLANQGSTTLGTTAFYPRHTLHLISGPQTIGATELIAMRYTNVAGTSIANSGEISVPFATKDYDTHGAFATPLFTAPAPGKYAISASVNFASSTYAISNTMNLIIYKNGAAAVYGPVQIMGGAATAVGGASVESVLSLVAGDTIEIRANNTRTAGATLLGTTAGTNHVNIQRVGL